jgi:hypothetical protein
MVFLTVPKGLMGDDRALEAFAPTSFLVLMGAFLGHRSVGDTAKS